MREPGRGWPPAPSGRPEGGRELRRAVDDLAEAEQLVLDLVELAGRRRRWPAAPSTPEPLDGVEQLGRRRPAAPHEYAAAPLDRVLADLAVEQRRRAARSGPSPVRAGSARARRSPACLPSRPATRAARRRHRPAGPAAHRWRGRRARVDRGGVRYSRFWSTQDPPRTLAAPAPRGRRGSARRCPAGGPRRPATRRRSGWPGRPRARRSRPAARARPWPAAACSCSCPAAMMRSASSRAWASISSRIAAGVGAGLVADLRGLRTRLLQRGPVVGLGLRQLGLGLVRLLDLGADDLLALLERLLDRRDDVTAEHEQDDQERDELGDERGIGNEEVAAFGEDELRWCHDAGSLTYWRERRRTAP